MLAFVFTFFPLSARRAEAATPTPTKPGALVVDLGATPQTIANGLKPYGFVYELIHKYQVPVLWAIKDGKPAKGAGGPGALPEGPTASEVVGYVDFTATVRPNGTGSPTTKNYRSGAFVITAENAPAAAAAVTKFRALGVIIDEVVGQLDIPVYETITSWPRAVLDTKNGSIAAEYYVNAGIGPVVSSFQGNTSTVNPYRIGSPADLNNCDDIFVMPHADPTWETHQNLLPFIQDNGYFWAACHAVSVVENVDDPGDPDLAPNLNFLTTTGAVPFGAHDDGTPPYSYPTSSSDPILQFLGDIDSATQNGSEQIFLPAVGGQWRPTTKVLGYDPDHPDRSGAPVNQSAAILAYGRAFGNANYGQVMYEGGHTHNKGDLDDLIAAQRAFFNFHLLSGIDNAPRAHVTLPTEIAAGSTVPVSATISGGSAPYAYEWRSSCGGTFATVQGNTNNSVVATSYTAPAVDSPGCRINFVVRDFCGRLSFDSGITEVEQEADVAVTKVSDHPSGAAIGDDVTFTIQLSNSGPSPASGVVVTDQVPAGMTFVSASPSVGTVANGGGTVTWTVGSLAIGATPTLQLTLKVSQSAAGLAQVTNTASVTSSTVDTNPTNDSATAIVGPIVSAGIEVTKTASAPSVEQGGQVTYAYTVTNSGNAALTPVSFVDDNGTPGSTGDDFSPTRDADDPGNDDNVFDVGETWTFTSPPITLNAVTTNIFTAVFTDPLGLARAGTASETVDVAVPSIEVAKSPATQAIPSGGTAVFEIRVTNTSTGGLALTDIALTDSFTGLSGGTLTCYTALPYTIPILPAGESWETSCAITGGTSAGANTATATAPNPLGGAAVTDSSTATVTIATPPLNITKTVSPLTPVRPGATIDYTVTVTNTGGTNQTNVTAQDLLPPGVTWVGPTSIQFPSPPTNTLIYDDLAVGGSYVGGVGWFAQSPYSLLVGSATTTSVTTGGSQWLEQEDAAAAAGAVKVDGDQRLEMTANSVSSAVGAQRVVDLTGVSSASVSFVCDAGNFDSADDLGYLYVNGVIVARYTNGLNGTPGYVDCDPAGTATFGLDAYVGQAIAIGFGVTGNKLFAVDAVSVLGNGSPIAGATFSTSGTYLGNTGQWAGSPWYEFGEARGSTADAQVATNRLELIGAVSPERTLVHRSVDLTGYASATLFFTCDTSSFDSNNTDFGYVKINGVLAGTYVESTTPGAGQSDCTTSPGIRTIDLTPYVGGATIVEFSAESDNNKVFAIDNIIVTGSSNVVYDDLAVGGSYVGGVGWFAQSPYSLLVGSATTTSVTTGGSQWLEQEDAAAAAGAVKVDGDQRLEMTANSVSSAVGAQRVVDLTGVSSASVSFVCDAGNFDSADDLGYLYVNGVIVARYTNGLNGTPGYVDCDPAGTATFGLDAYVGQAIAIGFGVTGNKLFAVDAVSVLGNGSPIAGATFSTSGTYLGNTGQWAGSPWYEFGEARGSTADAQVATNRLELIGAVSPERTLVHRSVDLTGYASATLFFTCDTSSFDSNNTDFGYVKINGVLAGTYVESTTPGAGQSDCTTSPGIRTIDLTPYVGGATIVEFSAESDNNKVFAIDNIIVTGSNPTAGTAAGGAPPTLTPTGYTLYPGTSLVITFPVTVDTPYTESAMANLVNLASTISDQQPAPTWAAGTNTLINPAITIDKSASDEAVVAGTAVTYTYVVTNTGNGPITDATVTDDRIANDALIDCDDGAGNDNVIQSLTIGQSVTCSITVPISTTTTNIATVSGLDVGNVGVSNDSAPVTVDVIDPRIQVAGSAVPTIGYVGTSVTLTYDVTNPGDQPIEGLTISDPACSPGPIAFVGGDTDNDGIVDLTETWTFECEIVANTDITSTVTVDGFDPFGNPVTSTYTSSVDVIDPGIDVVKTVSPALAGTTGVSPGTSVTFTIEVDNTGDDPLTAVVVTDDQAACAPALQSGDGGTVGVLDVGEAWIYTCSMTVDDDFVNGAAVEATDSLGALLTATDDQSVNVLEPSVRLFKIADVAVQHHGDPIVYSIEVTNTGETNFPEADVTVDDAQCALSGPVKQAPQSDADNLLEPGESWQYGCSVTAATGSSGFDATTGAINNEATVIAVDELATVASDTSDQVTVLLLDSGVAVEKLADIDGAGATPPSDAPDPILPDTDVTYSYTVTNTSQVKSISAPVTVTSVADDQCASVQPVVDGSGFNVGDLDQDGLLGFVDANVTPDDVSDDVSESWSYTCTQTISVDTTNTVTVSADDALDAEVTATDSVFVDVLQGAMSLTKTGSSTTIYPGDTVTYTYELSNSGTDTPLSDVVVVDDNGTPGDAGDDVTLTLVSGDNGSDLVLGPTETWVYEYTTTLSVDTTNAAVATADQHPDPGTTWTVTSNEATETVDVINPELTLTKTSTGGAGYDDVGDPISYSYTLENTGDSTLSAPFAVTDDKIAIVDCSSMPATLLVGESGTCTATYAVTLADLDAGFVTNTAAATAVDGTGGTVTSEQEVETVAGTQAVALGLVKTAMLDSDTDGSGDITYGDVLLYTVTATNVGNVTLFDVDVSDPLVSPTSQTCAVLLPGATCELTGSYTVSLADADAGQISNTGSAIGDDPGGNPLDPAVTTTLVTPIEQDPALGLVKTSAYDAGAGSITYTYTVTNTGNVSVTDVDVTEGVGSFTGTGVLPTPAFLSGDADLVPGEIVVFTATYVVTQTDIDVGGVTNQATATATGPGGQVDDPSDESSVDEDDPTFTAIDRSPAFTVSKVASPNVVSSVGDTVTYTITIENTGNVTLTDVTVTDPQVAPATPDCGGGSNVVASLAPNASVECSATYDATQADLDGGGWTNTVSVDATDPTTATSTETANATVTVTQTPQLGLVKTAAYDSGAGTITYTYTITNTGNVTVFDVDVVEEVGTFSGGGTLPSPGSPSGGTDLDLDADAPDLAPNDSVVFTAVYPVVQDDIDAGEVTNQATASALDPNDAPVSDLSDDDSLTEDEPTVTPITQSVLFTVSKSASPDVVSSVGEIVTYTITVQNTGNVTLTDVTVTDPQVAAVDCDPGAGESNEVAVLLPGAIASCTATQVVTQDDLDGGSWTNTASVEATDPNGATSTVTGIATVTPAQTPELAVIKTGVSDGGAGAITYTYVVRNTGNVTIFDVDVVEEAGMFTGDGVLPVPAYTSGGADLDGDADAPDLAPDDEATFSATYTVVQADIDAGSVANQATASGVDPNDAGIQDLSDDDSLLEDDPTTTSITQDRTIGLVKSGIYSELSDEITYTYTVTNTGNVTLYDIDITEDAGSFSGTGLVPSPVYLSGGADLDGDADGWDLAPSSSLTFTATYEATQADVDAGEVSNQATVSGVDPNEAAVEDLSDDNAVDEDDPTVTTILRSAQVSVSKSASPLTVSSVGETVTYTITVQNTGNVTLSGVTVTDPQVAPGVPDCDPGVGESNVVSTMLPGATATCSASYPVTQADLDAGAWTNTATVTATGANGASVEETGSATVDAVQMPELEVVKTSVLSVDQDGSADITLGDVVVYTVTATNTGNVSVTDVVVSDPMLTPTSTSCATLAPGGSCVLTGTHTVTLAEADDGEIVNVASAVADDPNDQPVSDTGTLTTPVEQDAQLGLVKTSAYTSGTGEISYTYTVTNTGNVTVTGVTVTETTFSGTGTTPTPALATGDEDLAPGESATFSATYAVTQTDVDTGQVVNQATAIGTGPAGSVSDLSDDDSPLAGEQDPTETTITRTPAVEVVKTAGPIDRTVVAPADRDDAGDTVVYTYTVSNEGNVTLSDVVVTDDRIAAPGTALVCADGNTSGDANVIESLAVGGAVTCTATYPLTQADVDAGSVTNVVTVTADDPSGDPVTPASDTLTISVTAAAALSIDKRALDSSYASVGDELDYEYEVTNSGNVTIDSIAVDDDTVDAVPTCSLDTLAPGETTTCSASYTVDQADLDAGSVTNIASASGLDPSATAVVSPPDTATVDAGQVPALTLAKSADVITFSGVGQWIRYTYEVTNTGNVTVTGFTVDDDKIPTPCTMPATSLAPAASTGCESIYEITQADLDAGGVTNVAYVSGLAPNGDPVDSPTDSVTVAAIQDISLTIVKSSVDTSYVAVGDELDYSYLVTNTGNVTIDSVAVADDNVDAAPSCPATSLAPSASTTCTAVYTVTQADLNAGSVTNVASASGSGPQSQPVSSADDTLTIDADQLPSLSIDKSVDQASIAAPGTLTYAITVVNTGNVDLTNVVVSDVFAGGATLVSGDVNDNDVLETSETWIFSADYDVTQADINNGGDLVNMASVVSDQTTLVSAGATTTVTQLPSLSIDKVVDEADVSAPGTLTYTITVVNTGNVDLTGVVVSDVFAGGATLSSGDGSNPGVLDVGETWVYTADYDVTQADINAGTALTNSASVVSDQTTLVSAGATTTVTQLPSLSIDKVVDEADVSAPGTLTYTITVVNTGNVDLTNVVVSDVFAGGATLVSGDVNDNDVLETSETWIYTADYGVTQADINNGGDLVNSASVVSDQTTLVSAGATTTVTRSPSLSIDEVVDETDVSAPGTLTYTITVVNTGNVDLTNVVVSDVFAGGATLVSGDVNDNDVLETSETWIFSADYDVTQADINNGGDLVNMASVVSDQTTLVSAGATTTVTQLPSLSIDKVVDETDVSAPGTLTYTITVVNTGNVDLTNVVVSDVFAGGATLVSGDVNDNDVLETSETWIFSADYDVTQADINNGGDLVNSASVVSDQTTLVSAGATTTVTQSPSLSIDKVVDETDVSAPGTLTYTITVVNTGNVDLTNVVVSDVFAGGATLVSGDVNDNDVLETSETWIFSADYDVTQADINNGGDLVNMASVVSDQTTLVSAGATTTVTQLPSLSIDKVVDEADVSAPGTLTYTITVVNTGNVDLTNVVVSDVFAGGATLSSGDGSNPGVLDVGETWVYTADYDVTQADINAGTALTNSASVVSDQTTLTSASATTTIVQSPSLIDRQGGR